MEASQFDEDLLFPYTMLNRLRKISREKMLNESNSDDERDKVKLAERKSEAELKRQPLQGQLMKFTNVVKGWQYRYFMLDPVAGELKYYLTQENLQQKLPRGKMSLAGATVIPSEDDSLVFSVNPTTGDGYKLRATDTRQKQEWINRLRLVAEYPLERKKQSVAGERVNHKSCQTGMLANVNRMMTAAAEQQLNLSKAIEDLPDSECFQREMLELKATSQAVLFSLDNSAGIMRNCLLNRPFGDPTEPQYSSNDSLSRQQSSRLPSLNASADGRNSSQPVELAQDALNPVGSPVGDAVEFRRDEEICDWDRNYQDSTLDSVEQHKTMVLNLLSRLKLGMDLTRVPLPTFILRSRSLLECCSDFLANSQLLMGLSDLKSAEARMTGVLTWYLSAFHYATDSGSARKPYNPLLGEVFSCTWESKEFPNSPIYFVAEQVSHHPPISAFYAHCPSRNMRLNAWLWTKSKFMGTSVSGHLLGEALIHLSDTGELYRLNFPTVYCRSILTSPWMELGGKTTISCEKTSLAASVLFHTKPFYGGKLHKVTAELKSTAVVAAASQPSVPEVGGAQQQQFVPPNLLMKVTGEWNGRLELRHIHTGTVETVHVDVAAVGKAERKIRPLEKQNPKESRRLWRLVTEALRSGNEIVATAEKNRLEATQREEISRRSSSGYQPKFFHNPNPTLSTAQYWFHKDFPTVPIAAEQFCENP